MVSWLQQLFRVRGDRISRYYRRRLLQHKVKLSLMLLGIALVLLYWVVTYVAFPVKLKEGGMMPFSTPGSYLVFDRLGLGLKKPYLYETPRAFVYRNSLARGELVALLSPEKQPSSVMTKLLDLPVFLLTLGLWKLDTREHLLRRVLALPGERINIVNKTIYINGAIFVPPWEVQFEDVRVLPEAMSPRDTVTEVVIPGGYVFVVNDRWDHLTDSRTFGLVPVHRLEGIYWFHLYKAKHE